MRAALSSKCFPYTTLFRSIAIKDAAGDASYYYRNGTDEFDVPGQRAENHTHNLHPSKDDFTRGHPNTKCAAPTLDSFSLQSSSSLNQGDSLSLNYQVTDVG